MKIVPLNISSQNNFYYLGKEEYVYKIKLYKKMDIFFGTVLLLKEIPFLCLAWNILIILLIIYNQVRENQYLL